MLDANTYTIEDYDEAGKVTSGWNKLAAETEKLNKELPPEYKDAFFELALHPVKACANLNDLYYAVALNRRLAKGKVIDANEYADQAKQLYINDSLINLQYNNVANGKWNHMMDQTHIGYTYWQQPLKQTMPLVTYVPYDSAISKDLTDTTDDIIDKERYSPTHQNKNTKYPAI